MPTTDSIKSYQSIPTTADEPIPNPIPKTLLNILGFTRVAAGTGLLIAPLFIGKLFHVPVTASSALLARGVGGRDLVIGELLLTADQKEKERKQLKRALWAGIAIDTLDLGATIVAGATGQLSRMGAGMFGGAAVSLVVLGLVGLRKLE